MSGKSTDGKGKAHRAMPDSVWYRYARLQEFADKGVWPSSAGTDLLPVRPSGIVYIRRLELLLYCKHVSVEILMK